MSTKRVLVVGTTSDYIEQIRQRCPGRAVFLTDPTVRASAQEPDPDPAEELVVELNRGASILPELERHLALHDTTLEGLTCFDCETLPLAAELAHHLHLDYPSPEVVDIASSKYASKRVWKEAGIACPETGFVDSHADVDDFCSRFPGPVVLKPTRSSGSRLVFKCRTPEEAREAFSRIRDQMAFPGRSPEGPIPNGFQEPTPHPIVIEQYVGGPEYSADLLLEGREARLVRVARKIMDPRAPTGTVLGYDVPARLPEELTRKQLLLALEEAARALGIDRAIVMVDFILVRNRPVILEMTPRPGGDCLPAVIRSSSGLDMLELALDLAAGVPVALPPSRCWQHRIGLRLMSSRAGVVRKLSGSGLRSDPRVLSVHLTRGPGHLVVLPPEDYDSRFLGYAVFAPTPKWDLLVQCRELLDMLGLSMEHRIVAPAPIALPQIESLEAEQA